MKYRIIKTVQWTNSEAAYVVEENIENKWFELDFFYKFGKAHDFLRDLMRKRERESLMHDDCADVMIKYEI